MKKMGLKRLVFLAILGAWALVLRMFDFPILPMAPFLKVDFSDLMVLIGLIVNGPIGAILVAAIRDLSTYLMKGGEAGLPIGATMSFIASLSYIIPIHYILLNSDKWNKWVKYVVLAILSTTVMTLILSLVNYYVALPLYIKLLNFPIDSIKDYVMTLILPFNLLKGTIISASVIIVLEILLPLIIRRNFTYHKYHFTYLTRVLPLEGLRE